MDQREKVTISYLMEKKRTGKKITMVTAYDYPSARLLDEVGIDVLLVGDSVGMVVLGYDSTIPVTMDEMIHHCKAVSRGTKRAFIIGDMPFLSYQVSVEKAIENAGRFIKEGGCDAVKLEGGSEVAHIVKAITDMGIPVCGHIGLTPQRATMLSGYRVQGKDVETAKALIKSAKDLEKAGVFMIVMECIPDAVAKIITEEVQVPTVGIGAGPYCDGQVLVYHDLLGLFERFVPKFVKQYVNLSSQIREAVSKFKEEVESGEFPKDEHSFHMDPEEAKKLIED